MTEVRITLRDFRAPGSKVCPDARPLFFDRFGLDWKRFCREGMTAAEIAARDRILESRVNWLVRQARQDFARVEGAAMERRKGR